MRRYRFTVYNRLDPGETRVLEVRATSLWTALEQLPGHVQPYAAETLGHVRPDVWEDLTDLLHEITRAELAACYALFLA